MAAVRDFEVVGDLSELENFRRYLYEQVFARECLQLEITEQNELMQKRGNSTKVIQVKVTEIHNEAHLVHGRMSDGSFVQIKVDDTVTLTVINQE